MLASAAISAVTRACPICSRALAETAPEGLCLVCLLEAGLGETSSVRVIESIGPEGSTLSHPRYFGDYEILREVGRGGMGVVYEARQFGTQRTVALKLLSAGAFASADAVHRFHTEAQAAARLEHPHIVPVYEAGMHDGQHFLTMRFMPGGTLAQRARAHPLDPRRAAEIIRSLARAIAYAHQHGVLHRDLKPGNVLLDEHGEPHLADFGLARLADLEGGTTLTSAILGTAPYMPPEQAAGGVGAATTAGDIYGLGAVLYELLTGQAPFTGASVADILRKVREEEPGAPVARKSGVRGQGSGVRSRSSDLQTICLKCLNKEPAKRYGTAQDLADDLERFLNDEPILARPVTLMERIGRWCRRRPAIAGLSAALVLAVLAGFAGTLWQLQQARQNAAENLRQIARLHVLNGVNLLQEGDHFRSLLWFAEALTLAADPPERTAVDRIRIASIVAMGPRLAAVITHDQQPVADAAFHPVKDQLATVGRDRRLRMWAIPTGELIFRTEPFDEPPSHVQFAPDGERLLVVSSEFNHARLLSVSNGEPVAGPIPHLAGGARNQPLAPRFDEAGKLLLTQAAPNTLQVWSVHDASPLAPPIASEAPVVWMNFSADGEQILVRTQDGRTRVGAWRTGNLVEVPNSPSEGLVPSVFGRDGFHSVPREEWGRGGTRPYQPADPTRAGSPDVLWAGNTVARGDSVEPEARGQTVLAAHPQTTSPYPREWPGAVLDRDHQRLLTFGRDRSVRLLDATTGAALLPPIEHPSLVENAAFSPDGTRFATVTAGGCARVWSTDTGEPLMPPIDHSPAGGVLEFSASGRFLFTVHPAHAVFVWDLWQTNEPPVLLRPHRTPQTLAESGQEGSVFVTRDPNSPIRVRALAGAAEVSLHPSSLKMVPVQAWFDATGQFIILEGEKQRAQIWHAATGLPVTPIFQSRYTTNEADYRTVKLPTLGPSRPQATDHRSLITDHRSLITEQRIPPSAFRLQAELLSGSRLDGTGGWKPLELGEIVARWDQLAGKDSVTVGAPRTDRE
jgi:WD40 repeat protein